MRAYVTRGRCRAAGLLGVGVLLTAGAGCALLFNQPPIARLAASPLTGPSPLVVSFDASASEDPDGEIASYVWTFGDGATGIGPTVQHTYITTGETQRFTATLTVRDDRGATSQKQQSIEVLPMNGSGGGAAGDPVARIAVDRIAGLAPLRIEFDASTSEGGDGTITAYNWEFGDGARASGTRVSHTFQPDATEEFTVTLYVWTGGGAVDAEQVKIVAIVPADVTGDERPHATFDMDDPILIYASSAPSVSNPTVYEVTFDPRNSYADAGHVIGYYIWDFGDGTGWAIRTNNNLVTHAYSLAAQSRTYVVRLFVYDDQGLEGIKTVNLTLTQPVDED